MSQRADWLPQRSGSREVFQRLSYLQYPAMLVSLGFAAKSLLAILQAKGLDGSSAFADWNYVLLFAGVGVGLSSLQDSRRTQNKMSLKVWQDPKKGKLMLWVIALEALLPIIIGLLGAFLASSSVLNQLSLGLVAFGLGMIGLLKTAIEMFEHHRLDLSCLGADTQAGGRHE